MFPLYQRNLPPSGDDLATALDASLRRAINAPQTLVAVREKIYPDLAEIVINLDKAKVRVDVPRPSLPQGKSTPALSVERLTLTAQPLIVGAASLNLTINATDVALHESRNEKDEIFLLLHRAANGQIAISISHQDLERLIGDIAKAEAAKHGIVVEEVSLKLRSRGPRSLDLEAQLRARKLFVRAAIRIAGELEIDDQLVAKVSNLCCTGEGAIATLACNVLNPHLRKLAARDFSLMALPLGEVQLCDLKLETTDGIKVSAEFGETAAHRTS